MNSKEVLYKPITLKAPNRKEGDPVVVTITGLPALPKILFLDKSTMRRAARSAESLGQSFDTYLYSGLWGTQSADEQLRRAETIVTNVYEKTQSPIILGGLSAGGVLALLLFASENFPFIIGAFTAASPVNIPPEEMLPKLELVKKYYPDLEELGTRFITNILDKIHPEKRDNILTMYGEKDTTVSPEMSTIPGARRFQIPTHTNKNPFVRSHGFNLHYALGSKELQEFILEMSQRNSV